MLERLNEEEGRRRASELTQQPWATAASRIRRSHRIRAKFAHSFLKSSTGARPTGEEIPEVSVGCMRSGQFSLPRCRATC